LFKESGSVAVANSCGCIKIDRRVVFKESGSVAAAISCDCIKLVRRGTGLTSNVPLDAVAGVVNGSGVERWPCSGTAIELISEPAGIPRSPKSARRGRATSGDGRTEVRAPSPNGRTKVQAPSTASYAVQ
jgi:hypothetical protein